MSEQQGWHVILETPAVWVKIGSPTGVAYDLESGDEIASLVAVLNDLEGRFAQSEAERLRLKTMLDHFTELSLPHQPQPRQKK